MVDDPINLPRPDPTTLTTDAVSRAVAAERDYTNSQLDVLRERLRAIDVATRLLNETVNRVPTDVTKEVSHLRELTDERFSSVGNQFKERDTRSERESRDNKVAVDAAFAAQKEAASEQNKSNTLAITKSEVATSETINKLAELFRTTTDALADKIDDLKERVNTLDLRISSIAVADLTTGQNRGEHRTVNSQIIAAAAVIVSLIVAVTVVLAAFHK